jgi:hypothetical protein
VTTQPTQLYRRADDPRRLTFEFIPKGAPAALRLSSRLARALLSVRLDLMLVETKDIYPPAKLHVAGYSFQLADGFGNELLAYHWHPVGLSHVRTPHLHLGASTVRNDAIPINETHLPTGVVTLPEIVRYLIEEIGVEPNRADWQAILSRVETDL